MIVGSLVSLILINSPENYSLQLTLTTLNFFFLGVSHKCLGRYFFDQNNMTAASHERYTEAISIFEWNVINAEGSETKQDDLIECYVHLLDLEDEDVGPISESRADLCYKLANCYVQVSKHEGELGYLPL